MPKRVIVIFPQFEQMHLIDGFRRKFDPLAEQIKPHITLVFPFESELSTDQLRAHVQQVVHNFEPFNIQLQGVTGHMSEYLFLNVKRGNDQVIELHDRLYTGPLARYLLPEFTYTPHLTVGRVDNEAAFREALRSAATLNATYETVVRAITVYCIEPDTTRTIEFVVRLSS
ncbi:2'-5' RNA ligase family protein [Candidatus Acetothermia bacterium]|nr:2'-5' RNA ligase family protein [Candidatus Acetothermia bacterium]